MSQCFSDEIILSARKIVAEEQNRRREALKGSGGCIGRPYTLIEKNGRHQDDKGKTKKG
jgi:hypothetical protein